MAFLPTPTLAPAPRGAARVQLGRTPNQLNHRVAHTRRTYVQPSANANANTNRTENNDARPNPLARAARILGATGAALLSVGAYVSIGDELARNGATQMLNAPAPIGVLAARAAGFTGLSVSEKLSQVPVFAVTNASGQPYLANTDGSGSQVGYIFFSHLDALNMLKDMQKNPGASDARVYIMGLDKAYEMVKAKPTPSGIRGSGGEELTMVFRFFPDSRQVKHAQGLLRKLRIKQPIDGVPVFVAKGLTVRKGSDTVVPLFLTKEDVDAAWAKLHGNDKSLPSSATIEVGNLLYIIQQMESGDHPDLRRLGFFAPRASVEYVSSEQAGPKGTARMHQNPVASSAK